MRTPKLQSANQHSVEFAALSSRAGIALRGLALPALLLFFGSSGPLAARAEIDFAGIKPSLMVEVPGSPEMEPWSEAPVWRDGEVFFSNRPMLRISRDRRAFKYLDLHVAGIILRGNGHILACEHFNHALLDIAPDGGVFVVAEKDELGKPLRGLNDLTADAAGNVYWTDPADSGLKNPTGRIYRITPSGVVELLAADLAFPNGLEVDPASRHLYVIESQSRKVLRYAIPAAGAKLGARETFFDFGTDSSGGDGLCFDAGGNLWIAEFSNNSGGGRVVVVSPDGRLLGEVKPGAKLVTNIAFGGPGNDEIFISTGGPSGVYQARVGVKGFPGHPALNLTLGRRLPVPLMNEPVQSIPSDIK